MQIGNAVSPMLSACLGECLCLAANEASPVGEGMIQVTIAEYEEILEECKANNVGFWCKEAGNVVDLVGSCSSVRACSAWHVCVS